MLPTAIISNPIPVPLVNTPLPGTAVTHVPYDNVAPPISNAQVNNNASPNSEAASADEPSGTAQAQATGEQSAAAQNTMQPQAVSAQAAFLAQLLSQDGSPETQTILVQYEKLVALSNVKYKPSNAMKPVAEPSSVFGKILQENRAQVPVQPVMAPQPPPRQATPALSALSTAMEGEAAFAPVPTQPQRPQPRNVPSSESTYSSAAKQTGAYAQTATRVDKQNTEVTKELA